jgi:hypothetical protein
MIHANSPTRLSPQLGGEVKSGPELHSIMNSRVCVPLAGYPEMDFDCFPHPFEASILF